MANIETYYLVDFENVNEKGLESSDELGEHDHICIFYTKNTPKISMEVLSKINKAKLHFYNIPVGKQSLDMSLVTVLGYLIGKNGSNCRYVIVSKDNDYKQSILLLKKLQTQHISAHGILFAYRCQSTARELALLLPFRILPFQMLCSYLLQIR